MNDLEWLNDQRPEVGEDHVGRVKARRALVDHTRPRRRSAAPRRAGFVAVAALSAAALAIAWPTGGPSVPAPIPAPEVAEAAPLVRLSQRIQAEPEPAGDATLVIRDQRYPGDEGSVLGYDLYLDDGRYFYGATKAELERAEPNSRYHEPLVKAAVAAPGLAPDKARRAMDLAVGGGKAPKVDRATEDNHVWVGSMDALLAGAGRKDVRAGVMALLATIETVKVSREGRLLELSATDFPDAYTETLFVDAGTGVPQKFVGGVPGEEPGVRIDYDVKRVTAATWADAAAGDAADRAPAGGAGRPERPARPAEAPVREG
jgi:hypothetical protein